MWEDKDRKKFKHFEKSTEESDFVSIDSEANVISLIYQ